MKKSRSLQSWYPHENKGEKSKCKLTCYSRESREFYQTGENVVDGTKCSYDRPNDICVQGKCVPLGCDMVSLSHYKFKLSKVRKKIVNTYYLLLYFRFWDLLSNKINVEFVAETEVSVDYGNGSSTGKHPKEEILK